MECCANESFKTEFLCFLVKKLYPGFEQLVEKANRGRANSAVNRYEPHSWEVRIPALGPHAALNAG